MYIYLILQSLVNSSVAHLIRALHQVSKGAKRQVRLDSDRRCLQFTSILSSWYFFNCTSLLDSIRRYCLQYVFLLFQPSILPEDIAQILGKCTAEIEQYLHAMNLSQTSQHGLAIVGLIDVLVTARASRDSVALVRVVHKVSMFST